jgi:hypothetical protein
MTFVKQIGGAVALGAAMLIGAGLSAPPAQAAYTLTLEQVGSNVFATDAGHGRCAANLNRTAVG